MSDGGLAGAALRVCGEGERAMGDGEARGLLAQLPGWGIERVDGVCRLRRVYEFDDFMGAMDLAGRIAALAEEHGHHPDLHIAWGRLAVEWWTHSIGGLHHNDFVMAARTGRLYDSGGQPDAGRA